MALPTGRRLGPYEIVAPLGAGGMGEVYEARDTRLGRTVAIKVLPEGLAESPERRARFEREARTVSRLAHPHVCTLHDVGEEEGIHFLVLEHCEGETLAQRLARGTLSLGETLRYGAQIAEALDAAHRRGIVHRDLKPANVMLTASGVKLLDFGLARLAAEGTDSVGDLPTMTVEAGRPLTEEGTVLGTFPYLAPEQVEGGEADARSDIFALGAVLYEMVAGRRAFEGKSAASVMAAVLRAEPEPLSRVKPVAPPALDHVVSRCLAKDPEERWQSAKDVAVGLRWISEAGSQAGVAAPLAKRRRSRERLAWGLLALAVAAAVAVVGWATLAGEPEPALSQGPIRFTVPAPGGTDFVNEVNSHNMALSPDGRTLAMVVERDGEPALVLRALGEVGFRYLEGTAGASSPFWSPDGELIAFFAGGALKKIPSGGGPVRILCKVEGRNSGAWSPEGTIVFTQAMMPPGGIFKVPATGGTPAPLVTDDEELAKGWSRFPHVLPDGKRVLFHKFYQPMEANVLAVADLETGHGRALFPIPSRAEYDPGSGRLLYVADGTLVARPFDLDSLSLHGEAVPLAQDLPTFISGWTPFAVSPAGVIAHLSGPRRSDLVWRDRAGHELGRAGSPALDADFALSPDERRAVVETETRGQGESDLWLLDLERGTRQRLTSLPGSESSPVWSPDGTEILFINHGSLVDENEGIHRMRIGGGGTSRLLSLPDTWNWPQDWSRSGEMLYVAYSSLDDRDLWTASLVVEEPSARPVLATSFGEGPGRFAPDGRWIAYVTDQSEPQEVFVVRADGSGATPVSAGGGAAPRWRGDGTEVFYLTLGGKVMAVTVDLAEELAVGVPRELFAVPHDLVETSWEISADGERFLFLEETGDPIPVTISVGWRAALDRAR